MDSLEWLRKRHGSDNVVGWSIHRDEQAPHLAVYVVPLKDGKLNAKHFTGGRRCFPSYRPTLPRTWASGMVLNAASRAARRSTRRSRSSTPRSTSPSRRCSCRRSRWNPG